MTDQVLGGKFIILGMTYHFENYNRLQNELLSKAPEQIGDSLDLVINPMKHEAVAYISRMGQFYYYAISKAVKVIVRNPKDYIPILMKHFIQ